MCYLHCEFAHPHVAQSACLTAQPMLLLRGCPSNRPQLNRLRLFEAVAPAHQSPAATDGLGMLQGRTSDRLLEAESVLTVVLTWNDRSPLPEILRPLSDISL